VGEVMVTGATGGIGRAVVAGLAAAGHQVTAIGSDPVRLRSLSGVQTIEADLARPQRLGEAVHSPARLDALVHCAGVSLAAIAPVGGNGAVWQETMAVNVLAAAELSRLVLPALRRSRGHVVLINAAPGVRAAPGWSAFAATASKAALRELADSLRREEACYGVRVTTIYPGGAANDNQPEVRAAFGTEYDPLRLIRPETLAGTVTWVLGAPPDAYVSELSVLAGPRGT
jgi:NADP-dependent 3-hydroxy acid dehydrogenase YdfG